MARRFQAKLRQSFAPDIYFQIHKQQSNVNAVDSGRQVIESMYPPSGRDWKGSFLVRVIKSFPLGVEFRPHSVTLFWNRVPQLKATNLLVPSPEKSSTKRSKKLSRVRSYVASIV
uniref:Uncharacterized protein n=1 Tax=Candidatus Kentrum sp. MB TaxID=2138164 RepID=A0A451BDK7_9GAMM|nr:MAG: hypothetical protein BECKMB1821I_GA0114274_10655 [Candidatus Kentron sp. MB]VFK76358.1 MAG: hypothetical protein BECKMB1821H_GA0114242_105310 [Candidatus Kentron sp. MB]